MKTREDLFPHDREFSRANIFAITFPIVNCPILFCSQRFLLYKNYQKVEN